MQACPLVSAGRKELAPGVGLHWQVVRLRSFTSLDDRSFPLHFNFLMKIIHVYIVF